MHFVFNFAQVDTDGKYQLRSFAVEQGPLSITL